MEGSFHHRPDEVVDPEFSNFKINLKNLAELTGEDTYSGVATLPHTGLAVIFKEGATSTDRWSSAYRNYQNLNLKNY